MDSWENETVIWKQHNSILGLRIFHSSQFRLENEYLKPFGKLERFVDFLEPNYGIPDRT